MAPLRWAGRLPAWAAGALLGTLIGLPIAAAVLWPAVAQRPNEPAAAFSHHAPTYTLRTPKASPAPLPSSTATPRATLLELQQAQEQANEEWARQEQDHLDREAAAVATRTVHPDRCCTRPAAPVTSPEPVPKPPSQTAAGGEPAQVDPGPAPETTPATPTPQPSDPTYTGPAFLGAYCSKLDATAIATGPEESVGAPVQCTRLEGGGVVDGYPAARWLPLPPAEATGGPK